MNEEAQKKASEETQKKANEEIQKRNTDCVYFLASPLTCKKGNECEYRHSENARVNPRDCWYWLNGNCLNPACAFRHPPLDGLSGAPSLVPSQPPAASPLVASGNANKPRGSCFFFNQGFCAKGDKCPFMHGTYSGVNLTTQKAAKSNTSVMEQQASGKQEVNEAESIRNGKLASSPSVPSAVQPNDPKTMQSSNPMSGKNNFKGIQFSNPMTLESNNLKAGQPGNPMGVHLNHAKAVHLLPEVKPVTHVRSQPVSTNLKRHNIELDLPEMDSTRQRAVDAPVTRSRMRNAQPPDDRLQNGMESEEWLGESSPGFDVLVDNGPDQSNHPEDTDYHSNHDVELGRGTTNGRERNRKREFARYEYDQTSMHDQTGYSDAEFQYDHAAYDPYRQRGYDNMGRKQHKHLDDWARERPIVRERRSLSIEKDSEQNYIGDLRHHISKRKRIGEAKAVDNSAKRQHVDTQHGDFHNGHRIRDDEHRYHDVTYKDQSQHSFTHNNRRLHGRIQMETGGFKREPFDNAESDYEGHSERFRSRSSPGRRGVSDSLRSTYRGKERGRMLPDSSASSDIRASRGQNFKNNEIRTDTMDFAAPKTLAQIKQEKLGKNEEHASSSQSRMLGGSLQGGSVKSEAKLRQNLPLEETKLRLGKVTHELSEETGFEGPKPLSDILKGKRQTSEGSDDITGNRSASIPYQSNEGFNLDMNTNSAEMVKYLARPEKDVEEGELHEGDDYEDDMSTVGQVADVKQSGLDAVTEHNPSTQANGTVASHTNDQKDTLMNEAVHRNGEQDLDVDHEEYDSEPAEHEENESWLRNADQMQEDEDDEEDNYIEDDDDDDFAKKLGGIFS